MHAHAITGSGGAVTECIDVAWIYRTSVAALRESAGMGWSGWGKTHTHTLANVNEGRGPMKSASVKHGLQNVDLDEEASLSCLSRQRKQLDNILIWDQSIKKRSIKLILLCDVIGRRRSF